MHYFRGIPDHLTPLHLAPQQGNVEVAGISIEHGAGVVCRKNKYCMGRLGCMRRQVAVMWSGCRAVSR